MKSRMKTVVSIAVFSLAIFAFSSTTSSAQQAAKETPAQEIELGTGMSVITPGLMEIGSKTRLFLVFGDKIPVTVEQRKKLEDPIQIGFELQLCGTNSHVAAKGEQPVPGCEFCQSTYEDLLELAKWILPQEERPSRYKIGGFDRALHVAPHSRYSRNEVVIPIHITHRSDFNREVDECENRCLKEMRGRLEQLGICEGKWRSHTENNNAPI